MSFPLWNGTCWSQAGAELLPWNHTGWEIPHMNSTMSWKVPRMTVSGQSSGGSMALQHFVAFSSKVDGVAIAGGSPYGCAALPEPYQHCSYGLNSAMEFQTVEYVNWRYSLGAIDPPEGMRFTPVILFSGTHDIVVYQTVMESTKRQLSWFVKPSMLHSVFGTTAGHVWSVDQGDCSCGACPAGGQSLCCDVNNCDFDLSGAVLRESYEGLRERSFARDQVFWVNQWKFLPTWNKRASAAVRAGATLMKWAIVYVPTDCQQSISDCKVHVNYHGCTDLQWADRLTWVRSINLIEYGEANSIVIVFPQARGDSRIGSGCWNWAAYKDDPFFDTQYGVQLGTVVRLVSNLELAISQSDTLVSTISEPPAEVLAHEAMSQAMAR